MEVTLLFLSLILTPPQSTHKHYECTLEIEEITPLDNHHQKCMGGKLSSSLRATSTLDGKRLHQGLPLEYECLITM